MSFIDSDLDLVSIQTAGTDAILTVLATVSIRSGHLKQIQLLDNMYHYELVHNQI